MREEISVADLHDRGDIAQKAAMHGDALAVSRRQFLAPFRLVGNELDDPSQPRRVDRVGFERIAVIGVFGGGFDEPRRPELVGFRRAGRAGRVSFCGCFMPVFARFMRWAWTSS